MKRLLTSCILLFATPSLMAIMKSDSLFQSPEEGTIFVNNRILAKVNGNAISTFDLAKKMDISFFKQYPEYMNSSEARFQYYHYNWKHTLEDLINKELILADAKESKFQISGGDLREEMESSFGPNIIANLDKIGLSYDEATKILEGDLIIRRMINMRVNGKAVRMVTPAKVRQLYDEYLLKPENSTLTVWRYRTVTVKEKTLEKAKELALSIQGLVKQGATLENLNKTLTEKKLLTRKGKVTVSDEIKNNEKELSEVFKNVLSTMEPNTYSQPFLFKSRRDKSQTYKIIYLQEMIPGGFPNFKEVEPSIKEQLLNDIADRETDLYLNRLRKHYHIRLSDIESSLPADYQPFILKK